MRNVMMAGLAVCLLLPAASVTQEAPRRPSPRPRVRVETREGPFSVYTMGSRGRIGVIVDTRADNANDKIGARIEGITPGGPAEKAGLKVGDVITRFNGTALGGAEPEDKDNEDSGPGMKLIELARSLDPGDTVQVEYRRGTDSRKATIVAEELGGGPMAWTGTMEMPEMRGRIENLLPKLSFGDGEGFSYFGGAWGDIELVELNPELGDYFGTREGVLVVRAPEDSTLSLKGGDVILSIGGRKPSSPMQAMRIIRSYDPGETVALDVLRKQKHVTVSWKVPDEERRMFRMAPRMHEEPSSYKIVIPRVLKHGTVRVSGAI
ncbi:MAG TPA: PDZ domain-containing protein [Gemmatimonadales bacterium]|jgi:C-terminal processing protease CtpA/Prc|nr:PDZ domain-containing protein [Gemmatimonadales bacterium]